MNCGDHGLYCGECYECRAVERVHRDALERQERLVRDLARRPPRGEYDEFDRLIRCPYGHDHDPSPCGDCVADAIESSRESAR